MNYILASNSPRRKELLKLCGVDFTCSSADIDEKKITNDVMMVNEGKSFYEIAALLTEKLAFCKADAVFDPGKDMVVIGSDTVVVTEDGILGKPADEEDAREMLISLCSKVHRVYTGVSVVSDNNTVTFSTYTDVRFRDYDKRAETIITDYIKTGSPMDKAGAYGIQDMGALLVDWIKGDFYTVMGLPVSKLYDVIR